MESLSAASMDDSDILEFQELSNGPWPVCHLRTVIPDFLAEMCSDDLDAKILSKKASELVVLVIDKEGVRSLTSELLKGVGNNQFSCQARVRRSSAYLIGHFFKNNNSCLVDEAPNMISNLIILLSDSDSATVLVACKALSRVVYSVPKDVLPSFIKMGLASGSAELREQSALGLGELIEVTSEKMLKEFVIPITTGPLIRIIGDRFPWQVKSAILSTLTIMIRKGGMALKPFLPQLQTTLVKCLQDNTRTVRSSAAHALGKLSALSSRIDPLVCDLLSSFQASSGDVRLAILSTLKGVAKHAGKSLSDVVRTRVYSFLKDLIDDDEDQMRGSAASILGIISQVCGYFTRVYASALLANHLNCVLSTLIVHYFKGDQVSELLEELTRFASSSTWYTRHGSVLTISSVLRHNPYIICASPLFSSVLKCLKLASKDEKLPVLEASLKALESLLFHLSQSVMVLKIHTGTSVIGLGSNDEIVVVADGRCGVLSPIDSLKCNVAEEMNSKLQLMQYGGDFKRDMIENN
ncbi:eIF-2-alpha kinase activator GCN1 [Orobanche minor]